MTQENINSMIDMLDEECSKINLKAKVKGMMPFETFRQNIIDYFLFPNGATCFDFNDLRYAFRCGELLDIIPIDTTYKETNLLKTAVSKLSEAHAGQTMVHCLISIPSEEFCSFHSYYLNCFDECRKCYLQSEFMLEIHDSISSSANKVAVLAAFSNNKEDEK